MDQIDALVLNFWNGTATQLCEELQQFVPKGIFLQSNQLTKRLNVLAARLAKDRDPILLLQKQGAQETTFSENRKQIRTVTMVTAMTMPALTREILPVHGSGL